MPALATPLLKHLVARQLCSTFSEARQIMANGSVRINNEKTYDISAEVLPGDEVRVGTGPMFVIGEYSPSRFGL
jgi:ribosomal protein S4